MKNVMWVVVVLVLGGIAAGYYYWQMQQVAPAPPVAEAPLPPPPPAPEPQIRHPIQPPATPGGKPLPPLDESDAAMVETLTGFFGEKRAEEFFDLKDIVRRFVVTVDNLPRKKVPMRYRLFRPVAGELLVAGADRDLTLKPENFRRYTPYVLLSQAVGVKTLVAAYVHFYPLFQEEYKELGYPKGYFNDRLVEAIDDMLEAPEVKEPIRLERPNVLYQFADPDLEALSAGQKILIRMGPENAARIKARLRELRRELTGQVPEPQQKAGAG
ncbi:MAG: DUF3014 domain-containing protein [Bacteroidota bacterium]